jgi:hypothetical protein
MKYQVDRLRERIDKLAGSARAPEGGPFDMRHDAGITS